MYKNKTSSKRTNKKVQMQENEKKKKKNMRGEMEEVKQSMRSPLSVIRER